MRVRLGSWLLAFAAALVRPAAAADPRPGDGLSAELLSPEADRYEALLRHQHSVEKRRQFDEQLVHLGLAYNLTNAMPMLGAYVEVNALNRLAIGSELGVTLWGFAGSAFLLGRPIVWSGRGRGALHAFTLQATYRYMQYGDGFDAFLGSLCHADCEYVQHVTMPAHFATFEAGFQHSFWSGWSLRYGVGVGVLLGQPNWRCTLNRVPTSCGDEKPPPSTSFSASIMASHAIVF